MYGCLGLCVWVWAHVAECWTLSIKGHTVTFHCEVFMILYDNAFLPNWLLQGMFYIILQSCVPIPDFLCQNNNFKRIMSRSLSPDCDFDWFHSNLNKQKPAKHIFWIVLQSVSGNWFPDSFRINRMQEFSVCSQILPWDYAVPRSAYFMDQYSQLYTDVFDPIWLYLAHGGL